MCYCGGKLPLACRHIPLELKPIIYQTIRFAGYIDKIILLHISDRRHVRTLQEHILAWLCEHFNLLKRDWRSIKCPCINKIPKSDYSGVLYPSTQQILFFFSKSHLRAGWTKLYTNHILLYCFFVKHGITSRVLLWSSCLGIKKKAKYFGKIC